MKRQTNDYNVKGNVPAGNDLPEQLQVHSAGLSPMKAELHHSNDPDGLIVLADVQTMELAEELVKRYNAYPQLVEALQTALSSLETFQESNAWEKSDQKAFNKAAKVMMQFLNK